MKPQLIECRCPAAGGPGDNGSGPYCHQPATGEDMLCDFCRRFVDCQTARKHLPLRPIRRIKG